jgi:hypothetical protein
MNRFRPIPELSNDRTPIKGFHFRASTSHNGVGA